MADNSSERKKDSISKGGVFVKQLSTAHGVIGLSHNHFQVNKEEAKAKTNKKQPIIIIIIIFK